MVITAVKDVLAEHGLAEPTLSALVPDETNYTASLMQPRGQVEYGAAGVRNRDGELAKKQ